MFNQKESKGGLCVCYLTDCNSQFCGMGWCLREFLKLCLLVETASLRSRSTYNLE